MHSRIPALGDLKGTGVPYQVYPSKGHGNRKDNFSSPGVPLCKLGVFHFDSNYFNVRKKPPKLHSLGGQSLDQIKQGGKNLI